MKITWNPSRTASCFHAASCMRAGIPVTDARLAATIDPQVTDFADQIRASGLEPVRVLSLLTALSADFENPTQLAEIALTRLLGAQMATPEVVSLWSSHIASLAAIYRQERAQHREDLRARVRPLSEQWESRGPGMLRQMAKLSDERFIPNSAIVLLVNPFVGGHGHAEPSLNRVTLEALLANPYHDLPEVVRLGWLLCQLNCDLPPYVDVVEGKHLSLITRLGTIPLALQAAESVEWAELSIHSVKLAIQCWHLPFESSDNLAEQLLSWWQTYESGADGWHIALAALDSMLRS